MRYEAQRVLGAIALSYPPPLGLGLGLWESFQLLQSAITKGGGGGGGWYESAIAPSFIGGQ